MLTAGGTGHRPLRLHRWTDRLWKYDFEVVYKPGKDNVFADCLSRAYEDDTVASSVAVPSDSPSLDEDEEDDAIIQTLFGTFSRPYISNQH
jgi:hypothetical protein